MHVNDVNLILKLLSIALIAGFNQAIVGLQLCNREYARFGRSKRRLNIGRKYYGTQIQRK